MKKQRKFTLLLIATGLFTLLFYHQDTGINVSLLGLFTWLAIHFSIGKAKRKTNYWWCSTAVFISLLSQLWYGDAYSFWALLLALLCYGLYAQYPKINTSLYPVIYPLSYLSCIFRIAFPKIWIPQSEKHSDIGRKLIAWIVIPAVFSIIFLIIYSTGSSLMGNFFAHLSFHFDFFEIMILCVLGFCLFFNLLFPLIPKDLIRINHLLGDDFSTQKRTKLQPTFPKLGIDFERSSGVITLVLLNIFLLIFIASYNYEQFFTPTHAGNLSIATHNRVNTVIFSILMAIVVLLFYFKSTFNFDKKSGLLRKIAYLWLTLNALLVFSALIKNGDYVQHFGLTFKRIGVFIYLLLCLAGLFIAFLKIRHKKTNNYLINRMAKIGFATFVVCSLINFSWLVTKYNLTYTYNPDLNYLSGLKFNKKLLYNRFHDTAFWEYYFEKGQQKVIQEQGKSFLSGHLYYFLGNKNRTGFNPSTVSAKDSGN